MYTYGDTYGDRHSGERTDAMKLGHKLHHPDVVLHWSHEVGEGNSVGGNTFANQIHIKDTQTFG
jgi:hypothetical protein